MEYQQNSRKDWGYEKMNKKYCRAAGAKKKNRQIYVHARHMLRNQMCDMRMTPVWN